MLQFKYMMFINFAWTLCRELAAWKREEDYIFHTYSFLAACLDTQELLHTLGQVDEVYSKDNRLTFANHSGAISQ